MRVVDIISEKRDGRPLTKSAIAAFVSGVSDGVWPDYQASALLMAIVLKGMTSDETWWLTEAMLHSGDRVDLSDIPGVKIGKHSTGGVGDKVSVILAPVAAACGVPVPKMSGRALGHTGGTLDKLESIPGFRTSLSIEEFKAAVREVGTCLVGQTGALVPADKRLYALRDVTGTVESIPLLASSIMSKKLAEGSDALVLDVKCGSGAFMKDFDGARTLAQAMVAIGARGGVPTEAVVTDMDAPLGDAVGNTLEIIECLDTLKGGGPADLQAVVRKIGARMLVLGRVQADEASAEAAVVRAIESGAALDRFRKVIERQGGNPRVVDDYALLPSVSTTVRLLAERGGYVTRIEAGSIGKASNLLGSGRSHLGDAVDHAVGILVRARVGERVVPGQPILELYHRDNRGVDAALALCRGAVTIGDAAPPARPKILADVRA
jgi:pyrimidine-nucleoside phosphorylase